MLCVLTPPGPALMRGLRLQELLQKDHLKAPAGPVKNTSRYWTLSTQSIDEAIDARGALSAALTRIRDRQPVIEQQ